jgi:2',3'-cyclic-nucleotide 2'-phosphodiesterase/3'-nucleotidase
MSLKPASFLRITQLAIVFFASAIAPLSAATERTKITVLSTTDIHGHIYPIDYFTQKPSDDGLARIATLIHHERKLAPDLLLIDSGDTIQGTPLAYFHNRKHNAPIDPMMLVMNSLHYDSMTIGNHEFNFGLPVLEKARNEATFPWLSANTYRTGTDQTAFQPYVIKEVRGIRIGILGLTTPGIPNWENPENYAGLEFRETVSEARKWTQILREREKVDAVIVAMHMGLDYDPGSGRTDVGDIQNENAALTIAQKVPGIDLILMAHTHRDIPSLVINGVLLAQAGKWGERMIKAELFFTREDSGPWTITAKSSRSLSTAGVTPDPDVLTATAPYHERTQAWLSRTIGQSSRTLSAQEGSLRDTALLDLIQRAQLDAGQADVSLAANFNPRARIPEGLVRVRDISALYIYENTLYVVEVTGAQLKAALEHSARYFLPYEEGKSPRDLIDPTIPGYNFDVAEGVSYEIDLRKPHGDRIQNLAFKGAPLDPQKKLRLAVNNYRFNGGGGYTMIKGAPVISRSSEEIRDLIIRWVEKHQTIPDEPSNNWKILP